MNALFIFQKYVKCSLSDTDMKNGSFRDLLGVKKVRKC